MLECRDLTVEYGDVCALDGASLDVPGRATTVLMGPSGCGKSTLLRVAAGLEVPQSGVVRWSGDDLAEVPPHRRGFGLMFQDYALFPHRTVGQNVAFGLRMAGLAPPAVARRVAEMLKLVGLAGAESRRVSVLSGGEQQRVALARSLAPAPQLLMLDEPIGSLDRDLRSQLMVEMRGIFDDLDLTVLYVTHDVDEALALADHIAVMKAGTIVRSGRPEALWSNPETPFVARFIGRDVVVDGGAGNLLAAQGVIEPVDGALVIPPEAVSIRLDPAGEAAIAGSTFAGGVYRTTIDVGGVLLAAVTPQPLAAGTPVHVEIDPGLVVPLGTGGPTV